MANNSKGAYHCLVVPNRQLGIVCKRRGQHTSAVVKSEFRLLSDDIACLQCRSMLKTEDAQKARKANIVCEAG